MESDEQRIVVPELLAEDVSTNREQVAQLLERPTESLNIETKTWVDPREAEGKAKLIKAIFALRNRNGGTFVMGFNDTTLDPDPCPLEGDLHVIFHLDSIQGLVTKFASEPFEIQVDCLPRNDALHPVIVVPEGVRVPVVVKANLMASDESGRKLLSEGDLYFRTLLANGTPSSAKIKPGDYRDLLEVCFREPGGRHRSLPPPAFRWARARRDVRRPFPVNAEC